MPPAYKLIFMTKQSDSGSRNTATLATTPAPPARLASKHLLGIEGLNPLEINALIAQFRLEVVVDLGAGTTRPRGT